MNLHKILLISIIVSVIAAGVLTILKIWMPVMDLDLYIKIIVTLGIYVFLAGLVMVLKADLGEQKNLKDNNYLD